MTQENKRKTTGFTLNDHCLAALNWGLRRKGCKFTSRSGFIHFLIMDYIQRLAEQLNMNDKQLNEALSEELRNLGKNEEKQN